MSVRSYMTLPDVKPSAYSTLRVDPVMDTVGNNTEHSYEVDLCAVSLVLK